MIEHCIVHGLGREDTLEYLRSTVGIDSALTGIVWDQLREQNPGFFEELDDDFARNAGDARTSASVPIHLLGYRFNVATSVCRRNMPHLAPLRRACTRRSVLQYDR